MRLIKSFFIVAMSVSLLMSCKESKFWFQRNDPEPPYRLFDLLDPYPALYDAFSDIDQHTFNVLLADAVNPNIDETKSVLQQVPTIIDPLVATIGALRSILGRVIYQDEYAWPNDDYDMYAQDFYSFMDDVSAANIKTTDELLQILRKIIGYIQYAHGSELDTVMADLIAFLQDSEGQNLSTELPLLQEGLGKLLLQANTYYDENNNKLGNAVSGIDALLSGVNDIATADPEAREALYNVMRELDALLTAQANGKDFATILQEFMINAEDYATIGGQYYGDGATPTNYYSDTTGVGIGYYVNTELRNGLKAMWPALAMLFIRGKENEDLTPIKDELGRSAVECLSEALYSLKLNSGIDFENYYLEPSLKRMAEYNGLGQQRSSASYKVSYLDHLLYTLKLSNEFGFLTRKASSSDEPYANDSNGDPNEKKCRLHGEPSGGIMTINDSLYSMTSGAIKATSSQGDIDYFGSYNLALDLRVNDFTWPSKGVGLAEVTVYTKGQGNYVYRSSYPFGSSQVNSNKFYMGYDFPTLALLGGASVGDAGIPNGGKTGITPTSNETTVSDANNDYRTYYPYVGNGLGELNTGRWVMGWIARACWEGEGPYYYDPEKAGKTTPTVEIEGTTYKVYFRPDGRIYALKDTVNGDYFYPEDGGNDVKDIGIDNGGTPSSPQYTMVGDYYLRENRYRYTWHTDYYLMKADYVCYDDDANHGGPRYYSPASVVTDKYKMHSLNGTTGQGKHGDDSDASTNNAGALWFWERISENDPNRACASQEEAMYRNFQWLILEKKFVFVMPMRSYLGLRASACGANFDINVDALVYAIIEGNGIAGIANAKKGSQLGYWALSGSEGVELGHNQPTSGKNYGDSHTLADGRVWVLVKEDASWDKEVVIIVPMTEGDYVDINKVWNDVLKGGNVLPNVVGENIVPIARMAFLQQDFVASGSADIGDENSTTWQNRNKLLPVVAALAGTLHTKSYYDPPASGYWYNFAGNHKYPLKYLGDMISSLVSPLVRYYKTPYAGAPKGWFVPHIKDPHGRGTYAFFTPKPQDGAVDFKPTDTLHTVANILTENSTAAADGLIPAIANTQMVSKLLAFLQKTGRSGDIYNDIDPDSTKYTDWGARRKIMYGLEQIVTNIKAGQSKELQSGYYTESMNYPTWFFTNNDGTLSVQDESHGVVNLNTALDELIGSSDTDDTPEPGEKGLAVFVDDRPVDNSNPDRNWINYNKLMTGLGELLSNKGTAAGTYNITEDLITVVNRTLTSFSATNDELKGLRHTLGTALYYYDDSTSQWVVPNELKDITTSYLPQVLQAFNGRYDDLLVVANNMLIDDGFMEYFMTNLSSSYPTQDVLTQLYDFLGTDLVANADSRLWNDLNELLLSLVIMMNDTSQARSYRSTFEDYTKPVYNSMSEYLYSDEFDPYSGLGQILMR